MFFLKLHAKQFLLSTALIPSLALTTIVKVHAASNTEDAFDNAANTFFWDIMDSSPINLHYSFSFPEDYKPSDNPPLGSFSETFTETAEILNRAKENLSAVEYNSLTAKQKQVYQLMNHYIDINLEYCTLPDYTSTLGPMSGILSTLNTTITEYYLLFVHSFLPLSFFFGDCLTWLLGCDLSFAINNRELLLL